MIKKTILISISIMFIVNPLGAQTLDLYLRGHTPKDAAWRSAVLPGWGQFHNGNRRKGWMILGFETIGISSAYILYRKADSKYDKYKDRGVKNNSLYNDYESLMDSSMTIGALCALVWGYGIIESYFTAKSNLDFSIDYSPDGARFRVAKRF